MEIQLWREILAPYSQAVDELLIKFNHIIADYKNASMYSPIEAVTGRVKTISSILDKLQKKNIPMDQIVEEMDDIAGIRIMCQFVEDIYKVVEIIRSREDMEVREEKRLQKLPHDNQLQGQYHSWKQDHTGRDTDKDTCHEFLGNYRTFTAVQIQKEYS